MLRFNEQPPLPPPLAEYEDAEPKELVEEILLHLHPPPEGVPYTSTIVLGWYAARHLGLLWDQEGGQWARLVWTGSEVETTFPSKTEVERLANEFVGWLIRSGAEIHPGRGPDGLAKFGRAIRDQAKLYSKLGVPGENPFSLFVRRWLTDKAMDPISSNVRPVPRYETISSDLILRLYRNHHPNETRSPRALQIALKSAISESFPGASFRHDVTSENPNKKTKIRGWGGLRLVKVTADVHQDGFGPN